MPCCRTGRTAGSRSRSARRPAEAEPPGRSPLRGRILGCPLSTSNTAGPPTEEEQGDPESEQEAPDVGEEGHAAPVRRRAEQAEVRLDELVEEPGAEEE